MHDPYRQARSESDRQRELREAEWALWERERRRALLKAYAFRAVQIVAIVATSAVLVAFLLALMAEASR